MWLLWCVGGVPRLRLRLSLSLLRLLRLLRLRLRHRGGEEGPAWPWNG